MAQSTGGDPLSEEDDALTTVRASFTLFRRILLFDRASPLGRQMVLERLSEALDILGRACRGGPELIAIEKARAELQPSLTVETLDSIWRDVETAWTTR
jgi:hypothetical protein